MLGEGAVYQGYRRYRTHPCYQLVATSIREGGTTSQSDEHRAIVLAHSADALGLVPLRLCHPIRLAGQCEPWLLLSWATCVSSVARSSPHPIVEWAAVASNEYGSARRAHSVGLSILTDERQRARRLVAPGALRRDHSGHWRSLDAVLDLGVVVGTSLALIGSVSRRHSGRSPGTSGHGAANDCHGNLGSSSMHSSEVSSVPARDVVVSDPARCIRSCRTACGAVHLGASVPALQ